MALIKCKECGHDVSDTAKVCQNCGAAVQSNNSHLRAVVVTFLIVVLLGWALFSHNSDSGSQQPASVANTSVPQSPTEPPPPPEPPAQLPIQSTPNYSISKGGGVYGYEPAVSDIDRQNGIMTKPLMMIRFQGVSGTRVRFLGLSQDGSAVPIVFSCDLPCEYVDVSDMTGTSQTMHAAPGSLIGAVVEDIRNGFLSTGQSQAAPANAPVTNQADAQQPANTVPTSVPWSSNGPFVGTIHSGIFDNCCTDGRSISSPYRYLVLDNPLNLSATKGDDTEPATSGVKEIQIANTQAVNWTKVGDGQHVSITCSGLWPGITGHYALPVYCNDPKPQ